MIKDILNKLFYILKIIMLLASFVLTLYIIVYMYQRLEKNIMDAFSVFIPFVLIFILFSINMILNQKSVKNNMFYNITCCIVFGFLLFAGYRAIYDDYMVANIRLGYGINFNYYADIVAPMQVMIYGLCASNILLMFDKNKNIEIENNNKNNIELNTKIEKNNSIETNTKVEDHLAKNRYNRKKSTNKKKAYNN